MVELSPRAHVPADHLRGALALGVERPIEIARDRIVPARFGVAQQRQRLHAPSRRVSRGLMPDARPKESRDRTRATASSSVTRATGVPGGKALSSRDGLAADSKTNAPRSSARRISRPNAWASRARTMRSS